MKHVHNKQSGKIVITILVLINLAFLAVIFWLLNRPGVGDLKPASGETAYLMVINKDGEPIIYSKNGIRWAFCQKDECKDTPSDLDVDFPYENGFVLAQLNSARVDDQSQKAAGISELLVSAAFANTTSDGECPVIGYKVYNKRLVKQYPSPELDPDCPPN